jgi:hypothetical protein
MTMWSDVLGAWIYTSTERLAIAAASISAGVPYYEVDTKAFYIYYSSTWYAM